MFPTIAILVVGCFVVCVAVLVLASVTDGRREASVMATRASGRPAHRVPHDLPRAGAVSVVDGRRGHYLAADGHGVVYGVVLRPLRWRARGETCLVARSGGSKRWTRQFRLSLVESTGA